MGSFPRAEPGLLMLWVRSMLLFKNFCTGLGRRAINLVELTSSITPVIIKNLQDTANLLDSPAVGHLRKLHHPNWNRKQKEGTRLFNEKSRIPRQDMPSVLCWHRCIFCNGHHKTSVTLAIGNINGLAIWSYIIKVKIYVTGTAVKNNPHQIQDSPPRKSQLAILWTLSIMHEHL